MAAIPKQLNSDMLSDDLDYVFINNSYCKSEHDVLKKLNNYSTATTSNWITVNPIFIKKPSHVAATISIPCFDCPEKEELERRRLPTF